MHKYALVVIDMQRGFLDPSSPLYIAGAAATVPACARAIDCCHRAGVPVVFAKKSMSINLDYDNYETKIQSFTHKKIYNVIVSKKFLTAEDHVLIIDDFLANGCAMMGLLELVEAAGATVEGIGVAIEKGFQPGGDELRREGYKLASLAIVDEMGDNGSLKFRETEY